MTGETKRKSELSFLDPREIREGGEANQNGTQVELNLSSRLRPHTARSDNAVCHLSRSKAGDLLVHRQLVACLQPVLLPPPPMYRRPSGCCWAQETSGRCFG